MAPGADSNPSVLTADQQYAAILQKQIDAYNAQLKQQQDNFNSTQYANLATNLLSGASQLTGPKDYFQFLKYAGGGQDILKSLYGTTARPAFSGPNGDNQPLTIQDILQQLGLVPGASPTPAPSVSVSGSPQDSVAATGSAGARYTIPPPNQVDPAVWDSLGQTGQQFVLGAAGQAGWDPAEYQRQIEATRPAGTASGTTATLYGSPASAFGGAGTPTSAF